MNKNERSKLASQVTWVGFWANAFLSVTKVFAGIVGRSEAMVADGIHSLSDLLSDAVVLFGFRMIQKPADRSHDYGHGKFETLSALVIGIFLLLVAGGLFYSGIKSIWGFLHGQKLPVPGLVAFVMAVVSIVIKEILFRMTFVVGKRIDSQTIIANAWHHRSDMFSSLATFIGIGGAIVLGPRWAVLDPLAALLVSFLIAKVGIGVLKTTLFELTDASLDNAQEQEILQIALQVDGVYSPHHLKTRKIGASFAVDIDIRVDGDLSVTEGHKMCTQVENLLRERFGSDIFIRTHIEPLEDDGHPLGKD